jgi:hypothetical protein
MVAILRVHASAVRGSHARQTGVPEAYANGRNLHWLTQRCERHATRDERGARSHD